MPRNALTMITLLLLLGCGRLAGLDDYGVGEDTVRDDCGPLEAPGQIDEGWREVTSASPHRARRRRVE